MPGAEGIVRLKRPRLLLLEAPPIRLPPPGGSKVRYVMRADEPQSAVLSTGSAGAGRSSPVMAK
jgi:hypothetical protein